MKYNKGKNINIFFLYGYRNLGFLEIQALISEYLDKKNSILNRRDKINNSPAEKPISDNTIIPAKPASDGKYLYKVDNTTPANITLKPDPRHSSISFNTKPVKPKYHPNRKDILHPMVTWVILYMIHLILNDNKKNKEWFNSPVGTAINNNVLIQTLGHKRQITIAKDVVEKIGLMDKFLAIPDKNISDRFRISAAFRANYDLGKVFRYPCSNIKVNKRLLDTQHRHRKEKSLDLISKKTLRILKNLRIKSDEANDYILDEYNSEYKALSAKNKLSQKNIARLQQKRDRWLVNVLSIEHIQEDAFVKRDDFSGRLYSSLTMMPKPLRKFLYFDNCDEELCLIDLSNAMAVFLVIELIEYYRDIKWFEHKFEFGSVLTFMQMLRVTNEEDVIYYCTMAMDGSLYHIINVLLNNVQVKSKMGAKARKKIKTALCKHVFYGKNRIEKKIPYTAQIEKTFKEYLPNVYNMIEDTKRYGYKTLARNLFRKEVSIFIDNILYQLIRKEKRMNILSIHDGILCPASKVNDVIEKVESAFKKWDMQVQVTTENIHTGEEQKKILNPLPDWESEPLIKYKMKGKDYAMQAMTTINYSQNII